MTDPALDALAMGPNAEAIGTWNDIVGPKYQRHADAITRGFGAHSDEALRRHPVRAGERILEVGCGFGDLSVVLAARVGATGAVVAVDCTASFLAAARARPDAAGVAQLDFVLADAQTERFEPGFDAIVARFGTMFFQSPVAALRNLGAALRPDGRLVMLVWRTLEVNDWASRPKAIALRHLPAPADGPTCGPGPFSMANPETVHQILCAAGFRDVSFAPIDVPVELGSVADAIQFMLDLGPAGELLRLAGAEAAVRRPALVAELERALEDYLVDGRVMMPSASWCVTARRA